MIKNISNYKRDEQAFKDLIDYQNEGTPHTRLILKGNRTDYNYLLSKTGTKALINKLIKNKKIELRLED